MIVDLILNGLIPLSFVNTLIPELDKAAQLRNFLSGLVKIPRIS
jgi:hypothetical protein